MRKQTQGTKATTTNPSPRASAKEARFYRSLRDVFVGAKIEGQSGYINLMAIKSRYYEDGVFPKLKQDIEEALTPFPDFREELFDKLYTFFSRYFSKSGSIYFSFTPLHQDVYERVYTDDKDVMLFWKTHMLYYVKTDRLFRNLEVELDGFKFFFDVSTLEHKRAMEKREIVHEFKTKRKDGTLVFNVSYSQRGRKTRMDMILRECRKQGVALSEDTLERAFQVFGKQSEVDYFINKNAKAFLQEQFNLWLYQYVFAGESEWTERRIKQLQTLKDIAFKIIGFISQFEDELVKIWNRPKFVLNSNYVITLDRIAERDMGLVERLLRHEGFRSQVEEWRQLGIVGDSFMKKDVVESDAMGKQPNDEYRHLPIDTRYFKDLELQILGLFENLDEALDGWLIKSGNYQALNTILPKFKEKVQTIYIDPPFNTGEDFYYVDRFQDATWITLMENRMELARSLMDDQGNFYLHLDYNADFYGRILADKTFGKDNFRSEIIFKRTPGHHLASGLDFMTDSILWYSRGKKSRYHQQYQELTEEELEEKFPYTEEETDRRFTHEKLEQSSNAYSRGEVRKIQGQEVVTDIGWRWTQETFDERLAENPYLIYWTKKGRPRYKRYADEYEGRKIGNLWDDITLISSNSAEWFDFKTQKPEALIERIVKQSCGEKEIVLDFFLGIGTTTAVAHKLRRKWVGIEMGEHFWDFYYNGDGKETGTLGRMKEVLAGVGNHEPCGISAGSEWQGGGFFKYYDLEQYEDTLRKAKYQDADLFDDPYRDPYNQYVFLRDLKMLEALEVDLEQGEVKVDLSKLYDNIDIAETLSNLRGKWIKRITPDFVEFEDGEKVDFRNLDYRLIKPLIWW